MICLDLPTWHVGMAYISNIEHLLTSGIENTSSEADCTRPACERTFLRVLHTRGRRLNFFYSSEEVAFIIVFLEFG